MNHDDDTAVPGARGDADDRVGQLLSRGGAVEVPPPPHVREAVLRAANAGRPEEAPRRETLRRRWGAVPLLAAAAAGALVTWAGFELVDRETPAEVRVTGELAALTEDGTQGRAEVVEVDGELRLRVKLDERPDPGDGYLEVWLLRPDVSGMVTVGVLEGEGGEFLLPAGIDLAEYALVDISREHMDGDPAHGGDSLVRGEVG